MLVDWKPNKEQKEAMKPVWEQEMKRYDNLDEDSKLYKFATRWLNHRAEKEYNAISKAMLEEGGLYDTFAGDDKMMSLDEARKMNDSFRKRALGDGTEIKGYTDEEFKLMYDAYDALSEGDGFSKVDTMIGNGVMEKFRDHRITETEIDKFWPLAEMEYWEWISDMDEDGLGRKMVDDWLENGKSDEQHEMESKMFD